MSFKHWNPILLLAFANLFMTFAGFAVFYMKTPITRNYLYASTCLLGAAYFIFRD